MPHPSIAVLGYDLDPLSLPPAIMSRELSAGLRKRPRAYERPLAIKSIRDVRAFDRRQFKAMCFWKQAFQFRNSFPLVLGVFRPAKDLYRSPRPGSVIHALPVIRAVHNFPAIGIGSHQGVGGGVPDRAVAD